MMTWTERIANYARVTGFPNAMFIEEQVPVDELGLFINTPRPAPKSVDDVPFTDQSLYIAADNRVVGMWILGNDYRVQSGFYGGFPAGYLRRIKALFPDKKNVLHLFSGHVDKSIMPGTTVDINSTLKPDIIDDAQTLRHVPLETYDLVMADPPYSVEDSDHYQTSMIKRNVVMRTLGERLTPGCFVIWLDQVLPMYRKDEFRVEAIIGLVKSTNHRFRVVTVFKNIRGL